MSVASFVIKPGNAFLKFSKVASTATSTYLRCGSIFYVILVANFLPTAAVKIFKNWLIFHKVRSKGNRLSLFGPLCIHRAKIIIIGPIAAAFDPYGLRLI